MLPLLDDVDIFIVYIAQDIAFQLKSEEINKTIKSLAIFNSDSRKKHFIWQG